MELWNEEIVKKSGDILLELKNNADFVLIGGWAIWLYAQTVKSKDIDIYINFNEFFMLQNFLINKGLSINFNPKLNKYECKTAELDIDIYTPDHCNLIIPCKEVFNKKLWKIIGGFKTIAPEALLILKLDSERNRHETIKGFKDRMDILSLLSKAQINKKLLSQLCKDYHFDLSSLKNIIAKSSMEYSYFFPQAENLRELKKFKIELLKKMYIN
ncbi:hypothetical protein HYT57_01880 [Candidatus Woesearchaeota archaeon]|nr:hypothetical protein [Candidatus Woesearchaeota archaeon]